MRALRISLRRQVRAHMETWSGICFLSILALAPAVPSAFAAEADLVPAGETECVRGRSCLLDVSIENRGDARFEGAAGLRGLFDPAVTVESISAETRGLTCDLAGEGGYECLGSQLSIDPGATADIQLVIDIPADFDLAEITHTKEMVWPAESLNNSDSDNDRQVSAIAIIDPSRLPAVDLSIATAAMQDDCVPGEKCGFALTVTNNGPAAFEGSVVIMNSTDPVETRLTTPMPSDWSCVGSNGRFDCTLEKVTLASGESRSLALTMTTVLSASGTLSNCAEVSRGVEVRVSDIQRALNAAGYDAGLVDGVAGRRTRAAIGAYQEANGLAVTGQADAALLRSLLDSAGHNDSSADNDRACASVQLTDR